MTGLSDATTAASIPTPAMSPKYRSPARPRSIHETVPTSRSFTASGGSSGMPSSMASTLTVPVGTVNVLAMELGIPLEPPDAVKLLEVGTVSWLDLGLAGDRYFGLMAGVGITPLADMRDGLLDVCVLKDKSFLSTIWYWSAALINAHIKHPKVEYFRTEAAEIVTVEEGKEVLVQTDGEMAGKLPLTCRVVPRSLRVVVP